MPSQIIMSKTGGKGVPGTGTRTTLDDYLYQRPVSLLLVMCSGDSKPLHFVRQSRTASKLLRAAPASFPDGADQCFSKTHPAYSDFHHSLQHAWHC
jgi:hypothetical protein